MASFFPSSNSSLSTSMLLLLLLLVNPRPTISEPIPQSDIDLIEFALNIEYLEAEFFLWGAFGHGLDKEAPHLAMGGPPPVGGWKAVLDPLVRDVAAQFAYEEVGHIRAIQSTVRGFPRPLLDLTPNNFGRIIDSAMGCKLEPPFDPYASSLNYLIASYTIPYIGLTGYVGANPNLESPQIKRLVAGLLGVEAGQDAVIRALLYQKAGLTVEPYNIKVAELTDRISQLRNRLGGDGVKDEGLVVPPEMGAEGMIAGNVIAGDENSLEYSRTPEEILKIMYGDGSATFPGGFYPEGAGGRIARFYIGKGQ